MPKAKENLQRITFRLPGETWLKLGWLAEEQGTTRADLIRRLLAVAVRGVTKPSTPESLEIRAPQREREKWNRAAAQLDVPLDELIRETLNRVANRTLGED